MELIINDRIRNRRLNFFNEFTLQMQYAAVADTFGFKFYFNPNNIEHKELACIGHYHICKVTHNNETLINGLTLSQKFTSGAAPALAEIAGYSLCGVLEDCELPPDMALQFDNLSIRQIAQQVLSKFNLSFEVSQSVAADMDSALSTTTANVTQNVSSFLRDLCSQKNIIITHTPAGKLLFTRANTSAQPVAHFEPGIPATTMELEFNGQGMNSHITVLKQADAEGGNAGESTVRNPYVINSVYRPKVLTQSSGTDTDTQQAANNARSAQLRNLKLTITTDRWVIDNKIIRPGSIITCQNPEVYLYNKSRWFVEGVTLRGNHESTTATLTCVLPEVYSGAQPDYLFKGINLH